MTVLFTRKDYEALPEGTPVELCDGVLVKQPSPVFGHQRVQMQLLMALGRLLDPGRVVAGPVDVLVDELNVFVPDIVVLDEVPTDDAQYVGVPRVVVEVLSPATRNRDRHFKVRRLLGLGVKEVWLLDPRDETVEIFDFGGSRTFRSEDPIRSRALPDVQLDPDALFSRA